MNAPVVGAALAAARSWRYSEGGDEPSPEGRPQGVGNAERSSAVTLRPYDAVS